MIEYPNCFDSADIRIKRAQSAFELGFPSMAAKKRCLSEISRAYECLKSSSYEASIMSYLLDHKKDFAPEKFEELYWGTPDLHNWREKHTELYAELFPKHVSLIKELVEFRNVVKNAEIQMHDKVDEKALRRKAIMKDIKAMIEKRKTDFIEGVEMAHRFGGLQVTATAHLVYGHKGTTFVRTFWYLNGKFTALNVIIAVQEKYEADKKKGIA